VKIRPVVYLVPAVILAFSLLIGSSLLFRVFVFLMIIGLLALLWTWLGLWGLKVRDENVPPYCYTSDHFTDTFTLINESIVPKIGLKAEVKNNFPGYQNLAMVNVGSHNTRSWEHVVSCRRRGRYSIGPVSITATDPLGLFSRKMTAGQSRDITVYPKIIELPLFRTSFASLVDFGRGASGRRISQISPSASSIREMSSGDSQEHIHWRSTAHTGRLMVKVFDAEHTSEETKDAWVVLDMNQSIHLGSGEESTEEYCVTTAASLIKKYLDNGMRVGLKVNDRLIESIPVNTGNSHYLQMLEKLTIVSADGNRALSDLLYDPVQFGSGHRTVIVITPDPNEQIIEALRGLKNHGHSVVAVFIDSLSFGGQINPEYAVRNLGTTGVQTYTIRRGDNIARALDSSMALWYSRYV
jgi:uncharacterized protein (DUF58 family)